VHGGGTPEVDVALKSGRDLPQHDGVRYGTWRVSSSDEWDIDGIRSLRDYIDAKVAMTCE
jgi:hypothetical protein